MVHISHFLLKLFLISIMISFFFFACDSSTEPESANLPDNNNNSASSTGDLQVSNNLGYSVGVTIDGIYSAHLSGGNYFVKILSTGSHAVRVYNTNNSSSYNINVSSESLITINHSSWQDNNGASSPPDLLRVNNNISYSVNVDVDGIYRAKIGGNRYWGLRLNVGSHQVRIYTSTGYSRNYNISITSGSDYILNHSSW